VRITVLIRTHQRAQLLAHTIASLNAAHRPTDAEVGALVVANVSSDGTHDTRNHKPRLERTLRGLAHLQPPQSSWEILVVDNACTDGTADDGVR
jgi:hypothetical protein